MTEEITFTSPEEYLKFLEQMRNNSDVNDIQIEEKITVKKFYGDLTDEEMENSTPFEVVEINNLIIDGEIVESTREEVVNDVDNRFS